MSFDYLVILYICAGCGVASGVAAFAARHNQRFTVVAWVLIAALWWFWLILWIGAVIVTYSKRERR